MSDAKPRLVGINHVALEVGDIEQALDFYGRIFSFTLRGRSEHAAFIDIGDQFINLVREVDHPPTRLTSHRLERWFGVPLIGSRARGSTVALKFEPSAENGS